MCMRDHCIAQVRGPDEKLTLCEIHHIHDAENQRQTQSDSDIEATEEKAINQVIEEHTLKPPSNVICVWFEKDRRSDELASGIFFRPCVVMPVPLGGLGE